MVSNEERLGPNHRTSRDPINRNLNKNASSVEANASDLQRDMNNADDVGSLMPHWEKIYIQLCQGSDKGRKKKKGGGGENCINLKTEMQPRHNETSPSF